jgi:ABC-type glycerol-3-phosphate transport system substrate-binding protein
MPLRIKTILLSFFLAAAFLYACGPIQPVNPPDRPDQTPASTTTKPNPTAKLLVPTTARTPTLETPNSLKVRSQDLRGVSVLFWHPMVGEIANLYARLAAQFNKENEWGIQVKVNAMGSSGTVWDSLPQAQKDGNLPQLVLATPEQLTTWMREKLLVDLTDYIWHPTWGFSKAVLDGFDPIYWQQSQLEGAQTGIPVLRTVYGMFYNKTWAAELGFTDSPATPEQFQEQACAAAKVNNRSPYLDMRGTGGWLLTTEPLSTLSWMEGFGANVLPEKAGEAFRFNQPDALNALSYLRKMQELGCLWDGKSPSPYDYFANRYALFYTGTFQDFPLQSAVLEQSGSKDEWTFLAYPAEDGKPLSLATGFDYGIFQTKPEQQLAAWLFVRWLSQAKNLAQLDEAYPSLPVNSGVKDQIADYHVTYPWTLIQPLETTVRAAPGIPEWRIARNPLEDATWQVFNLADSKQLDKVLPQLDSLVTDLLR